MAKYCPKCGKEHINNEEYCVDCHTKLPEEKIILNDKTPDSIFRNEKEAKKEKGNVKKDTSLGRIFTYEKTKNTEKKVQPTVKKVPKTEKKVQQTEKKIQPTEKKVQQANKVEKKEKSNLFKEKPSSKKEINTPSVSEKNKRIIIYGGLILLAIFIVIIIIGVFGNSNISTNDSGFTTYNVTDYSVSIPNNYQKINNTDYLLEVSKDNVTVKFAITSLSENGYAGASIEDLQQAAVNNIAYNIEGTVTYNDLAKLGNHTGYNVTYTANGNITRDIGFVNGESEYDIIFTTSEKNEANLNKVESEIISTLKIFN